MYYIVFQLKKIPTDIRLNKITHASPNGTGSSVRRSTLFLEDKPSDIAKQPIFCDRKKAIVCFK